MSGQTESAGRFPYVVELYRPTAGAADQFGHIASTFRIQGHAAARVWTVSNTGTDSSAADLVTHTPRLLLKEPIAGIDVGWRLGWKGKLFAVDQTEERGFDVLVTLSPVAR